MKPSVSTVVQNVLSSQNTKIISKHMLYLENHVKSKEFFVKSSEKMVSVPTKNSIKNELMEAETVTEYPEENCESTIEDFGVYETEVKEEIISEFDTDDIVNDPNYFDQG